MSFFTNPGKVLHNIWDKVTGVFSSSIAPYLQNVQKEAQTKGEAILLEVAKDVLSQVKTQLGTNAKIVDILKSALDLGLPILESKGITAATAIFTSVLSSLLLSIETHASAQ